MGEEEGDISDLIWIWRPPLTRSAPGAELHLDSPAGPASAPWPPHRHCGQSRGGWACYRRTAGAPQGQAGRMRSRGSHEEQEEEEEEEEECCV